MNVTLHAVSTNLLFQILRPVCPDHDLCKWVPSRGVFTHKKTCPRYKPQKPRSRERGKSEKPVQVIPKNNTPPKWNFSGDNIPPHILSKYE